MPIRSPVRALPAGPRLISLLTSAEIMSENDTRWESGISYEPENCASTTDDSGAFAACINVNIDVIPNPNAVTLEPIMLWAADTCSSNGYAQRDWQGRARRKLAACESKQIETELWRGNITRAEGLGNPYLASDTATVLTGAPVTPTDALACLEQALSDCDCGMQGMIHATPELVTRWIALNLVDREARILYTRLGTVVVPGAGYDGSGPGASPGDNPVPAIAGSVWAYATSMVHVRLGPVFVLPGDQAQALNRSTNTFAYWAQRVAVFGFECCHFAIEVDSPTCATGS